MNWKDPEYVVPCLIIFVSLTVLVLRIRAKLEKNEIEVAGDQWPLLVYENEEYDAEDPWNGLFRGKLLVWVSLQSFSLSHS